jgi:hypothetical protein
MTKHRSPMNPAWRNEFLTLKQVFPCTAWQRPLLPWTGGLLRHRRAKKGPCNATAHTHRWIRQRTSEHDKHPNSTSQAISYTLCHDTCYAMRAKFRSPFNFNSIVAATIRKGASSISMLTQTGDLACSLYIVPQPPLLPALVLVQTIPIFRAHAMPTSS